MGNRITRTVLFAASALLSMSAFGAGAARFGTLRNSDWVVTNAWQAVSNKTHDLIIDLGQESSLPPNWLNVSNAAMSAVQSLLPVTNYVNESIASFSETGTVRSASSSETSLWSLTADTLNDGGIQYSYSNIMSNMESKISTNNPAFVSAVLSAPIVGADPSDLSELAEYGSYGTVGAALLALIAGLAALKRRMTAAETAIDGKADADDLPYALVVPGEWTYSGVPAGVSNYGLVWDDAWFFVYYYEGESYGSSVLGDEDALELSFVLFDSTVTATRASLPGNLSDRAVNAVAVYTTLTLPAANPGHSRDLIVRLTVSATSAVTWLDAGNDPTWDAIGAPPSTFAAGTYLYRFTEVSPSTWHCEDMLALVGLEAALATINGGVAP